MRAITKIVFVDENGEKFFGEGPARLLRAVEESGSLRSAAIKMGMAYTKALKILSRAEQTLGFALTTRSTGGKDGGGSRLTQAGRAWLLRYEAYRDGCVSGNDVLFQRQFRHRIGCVIMASGLGKRFGGDKLTADFCGKALLQYILAATDGLFEQRIVLTRSEGAASLAQRMNIPVLLHDRPTRSEAVRLGVEKMSGMDGCIFCPSDQPLLQRDTLRKIVDAFDGQNIVRTAFGEQVGAPILFPGEFFAELAALEEKQGGGEIARRHPERVLTVQAGAWELMDVDTPQDLMQLAELARSKKLL